MGAKKQRIEFSKGRIEFVSVKEEVLGLFASGMSKRKIFDKMCKEGKFTMRYNTFRYHLNKFTSDESANKNSKAKTGGQGKAPQHQKAITLSTPERSSGSFIRPSDLAGNPLI